MAKPGERKLQILQALAGMLEERGSLYDFLFDDCPDCVEEILRVRHHSLFVPRDFDVSPYFEVVERDFFPFKVPSVHLNFVIGLTLRPRPTPLAGSP